MSDTKRPKKLTPTSKSPRPVTAKNLSGLALDPKKHPRFANFVAATSNVCSALHTCLRQLQSEHKQASRNSKPATQPPPLHPHNTSALLALALSSTWLLGEYAHQQFAPYNAHDPDMQNAIKAMHEAFDMLAE